MMNFNTQRLIILSILFLFFTACKKEKPHPNYELFQKVAGTYDIISADVEGDSQINILKEIRLASQSQVNIIINSSRIFDISWPEPEVFPDYQQDKPEVLYALKPAAYIIDLLDENNEFIIKASPRNDEYVSQPENVFFSEDNTIKCTLRKKILNNNGVLIPVTIHATYKKSKNPPFDFFH